MTLTELSERVGVPERTIRYYIQLELVPPPEGRGPAAAYGELHVERLAAVQQLRSQGLRLPAIRTQLVAHHGANLRIPAAFESTHFVLAPGVELSISEEAGVTRTVAHALAAEFASLWGERLMAMDGPIEESPPDASPDETVRLIEVLRSELGGDFTDPLFAKLHHLPNVSIDAHLRYCQGRTRFHAHSPNATVCHRLAFVRSQLTTLKGTRRGSEERLGALAALAEQAVARFPVAMK